MLNGFTIGGFRNFPNPPTWISPLSRVNIFVGANNSGKSNVLRYIYKVLVPSLHIHGTTQPLSGIDRNQGDPGPSWIQVEVPFDAEQEALSTRLPSHQLCAGLKGFIAPAGDALIASVAYPRTDQRTFPLAQMPPRQEAASRAVHDLWHAITGTSGGSYSEHWYPGVANWVTNKAFADRSCHYVQTFRSISTRLPEFESEYSKASGDHLIDELAKIERPSWDNQSRKEDFNKLQKFLQTLLEDDQASVEISSDRSHIIVHMGGQAIPLEALGSGIHEVFMLAADIVLRDDDIVLLEEPETHLHPALQRKLMMFLSTSTRSQLFITTHSSIIIDTPDANIFGVRNDGDGARVHPLLTNHDRYIACRNLGYKASDLLQSNCILWVEGPSDRIYLSAWLKHIEPKLVEGVHYSIMFYGGRLLSHLSAGDSDDELIQLLPINRRCAMLLDSDKGSAHQAIREAKRRLISEVEKIGGFAWLTEGREIENYYSSQDRDEAIRSVHRKVAKTNLAGNRYSKPLSYWRGGDPEEHVANKITVAEWLASKKQPVWDNLSLKDTLVRLVEFIHVSNK